MARRKAAEKKTGDQEEGVQRVQADQGSVAIGGIHIGGDLSGSFTIGYTAEQVSLLLAQINTKFQPRPFSGECPYKGLEVFEEEDAGLFFGRERLVEELIGRVKESRTVFITGPSGSGKSSLVRAGLIHALKAGAIKSSGRWLYETMKPGREPLKDLALAFSRLKGPDRADYFQAHANETDILHRCAESVLSGRRDQRFVLFVDQFEEVFTQVNQEAERLAFLDMLAHAGTVENGRVIVLFAMRSDFVSNCAAYPAINELLSGQFRQIGAMQPEELVAAIALPAKKVGLPVEPELIAQIINDMKGEPGALPLMQFALKELFEARKAKGGDIALTLQDYLEREGIQKMLARHADATLNGLSPHQQELARSVFGGLIEIGRGRQDTRRTALFEELVPADTNAGDAEAVVQKLADARLVITDEQAGQDTVTLAHERLITAWPWLEKLIDENRDAIALQNEIANDAKEWDDHGRDPSYLYTGARLGNAREKLEARKLVLSESAREFIDASSQAHTDELAAAAGRIRRFRILTFGLLLALVAAGFLGFVAQQQSREASAQASIANTNVAIASTNEALAIFNRDAAKANQDIAQEQVTIARAGELAALAVAQSQNRFDLSLLLSIEAFHLKDTLQTRSALLDMAQSNFHLLGYLPRSSNATGDVVFSPDGKMLASGNADGTIILWDVKTRQPIGQPLQGHSAYVSSVAFSPDGKTLASSSADGTIILWDVETQQIIGQPLKGASNVASEVVFSPTGKILASRGNDGIILWDVNNHQPIGGPLEGSGNAVRSIAFSPDGKILAAGNLDNTINNIILWDVKTRKAVGQPLQGHTNLINSIAFSPDGKILASGSEDNTIILWDVKTRQPIGQPLQGHSDFVSSVVFSPDGKMLASSSADQTIILWNVETHQVIGKPLKGNSYWVLQLAFSPDGRLLVSRSEDNSIVLWDVSTVLDTSMASGQSIGQPLQGHSSGVLSIAFSPNGKILASGGNDGILLWDMTNHHRLGQPLQGHSNAVSSVAFSPDGKILASGSYDNTIILWDVATRQAIGGPLEGHSDFVDSIAFSPDGKILASGSDDSTIILWDVETQQIIGQPLKGHKSAVSSVAFSPDGKMLASGSEDRTIILWDVGTHQPIGGPLEGFHSIVTSVAFSPDGETLASGSGDYTITLWNVATHQPIGGPLKGHSDFVDSIVFSPDGKILASGGDDSIVILWDVETQQAIGQPLKGHSNWVFSLAFSPDGKFLASSDTNGTIILWDLTPESWIEKSCQRAGRNLTRAEWTQYFLNEPYRTTCPQWPLEPEETPAASPTP